MDQARRDLYRAGTIRKYILVVTDGENTEGVSPRRIARDINRRSEGAVRMFFVAFDIEVVFIYPWATLFKSLGWAGFGTMFGFIAALIIALVYCWKKGALEWE